ncbi:ATP-binding protein [Nocardiopsis dassonvillei]|uniref:ATP-binding protein n=1 Tax=Nocardiopsis dassonvillei TaxID=2014 RepID=UPI002FC60463
MFVVDALNPCPSQPGREVPSPPDGFTGRVQDLEQVTARLNPAAAHRPGAVVVSALSGMGGVGKTALALKAAQTAWEKGWFCAHLFVDLHGYTPHTPPVEAPAALDSLLRQAGTRHRGTVRSARDRLCAETTVGDRKAAGAKTPHATPSTFLVDGRMASPERRTRPRGRRPRSPPRARPVRRLRRSRAGAAPAPARFHGGRTG